jgi:glutathione synthase/RimK-type ligase-like ATP-grasp enzyme
MNNIVTIKPNQNHHSELMIHPEKAAAIGLGSKKFAYLSFGNQKHHVNISLNPEIDPENVLLSPALLKKLHLPDEPIYEIRVNQNEILIGPYIGLLVSDTDNKLTATRLNKMLVDVKDYSKLHGLIVVFALDKVDQNNRLIAGYSYHPVNKFWQPGIFPYPSSIYRTIGLSPEWKNHFLSVIGDNFFNSRFFGKWEMFQWFSKEPAINPSIPCTILYRSSGDVLEMLTKFPKIYLKPVLGLQGRGIVRLSMENKQFVFKYRENRENRIISFEDPTKAGEYLEMHFCHRRYLIQQAIDLLEYNGGLIDFRCVVQKNQSNAWICQAIIGRCGIKDSIVSNISSGGTAFTAENILRKTIATSEEKIAEWQKKIAAFAVTVCNKLDEYGINCGTLGLDIGIDSQGQLWLIEINNRDPDPGIALDVHNTELFYTLKTGPLFYAKFLAGFQEMKDD